MIKFLKIHLSAYNAYQKNRQELMDVSSIIRSSAKQAAALLRRENVKESKTKIAESETAIKDAGTRIKKLPNLRYEGFYKDALEEYVEAKMFYAYVTSGNIDFPDFADIGAEEVIGGISDFTGELLRKAITEASVDTLESLESYHTFIESIAREMTPYGFHGKLRQKYDDVERNVKKMESIIYDLRLKKPQQ